MKPPWEPNKTLQTSKRKNLLYVLKRVEHSMIVEAKLR